MTAAKLRDLLDKLITKHGPNATVCVNARQMLRRYNDVFDIVDAKQIDFDLIRQCDGDGYGILNKDGTERHRRCVVIS